MKKIKTALMATLMAITFSISLCQAANLVGEASDVSQGAVPDTVKFYGRLLRNGGGFTGTAKIQMKVYTSPTGSSTCLCKDNVDDDGDNCPTEIPFGNICLWESREYSGVPVNEGLFSVSIKIPFPVLGVSKSADVNADRNKYYEILVDGNVIDKRYHLDTVQHALATSALESGATVVVSTLTVGLGGNIYLSQGGGIFFNNTVENKHGLPVDITSMTSSSVNSQSNLEGNATVFTRSGNYTTFVVNNSTAMYVSKDGKIGINTKDPSEILTVNGDLNFSTGEILGVEDVVNFDNLHANLIAGNHSNPSIKFNPANLTLTHPEYNANQLVLKGENVGIGTDGPENKVQVAGVAVSTTGIRAGNIDMSETRILNDTNDLIFQKTNTSGKVGFGIEPTEKLQVYGGLKADTTTITNYVNFAGNTEISGNLTAVNLDEEINFSTTVIHGSLIVYGDSDISQPSYVSKVNVFEKNNTYRDSVIIGPSLAVKTLGVAAGKFDFGDGSYLQIGDSQSSFSNKSSALVLSSGDEEENNTGVNFYLGNKKAADVKHDSLGNIVTTVSNALGSDYVVTKAGSNLFLTSGSFYVRQSENNASLVANTVNPVVFGGNYLAEYDGSAAAVNGQLFATSVKFDEDDILTSGVTASTTNVIDAGENVANIKALHGLIKLSNNSVDVINITNDGQFGIGIINPLAPFQINHGSLMVGTAMADGATVNIEGDVYSKSYIGGNAVYTNNVERITSAGIVKNTIWEGANVGIAYGGTNTNAILTGTVKSDGNKLFFENINFQTEISGILPVSLGGTGINNLPVGVVRGNGANSLSTGTVHLNSEVDGVLSVANGGTNNSTMPSGGVLRSYGSLISTGTVQLLESAKEVAGILPVKNGGTGLSTVEFEGSLLYGSGTNPVGLLHLEDGQILVGSSSGPNATYLGGTNVQVTPSSTERKIYISIPQSLSTTAIPTFNNVKFNTSSLKGRKIYLDSLDNIVGMDININDEFEGILSVAYGGIGTANIPVGVVRGNGANPLSTGTVHLNSEVDGVLSVANGGTGYSAYNIGDIFVADSANSITKISLASGGTLIGVDTSVPSTSKFTGTANQINTADGSGSITLSLPQNIHNGASPVFEGITLSGLSGFLKAGGASDITAQAQVSLGNSDTTGILNMSHGGTGISSISSGIVHGGASLAGSEVLIDNASQVAGILPIANGGTNNDTFTSGIIEYNPSSNKFETGSVNLQDDVQNEILSLHHGGIGTDSLPSGVVRSDGAKLSTGTINLSSEVTGALTIVNGGTGENSFSANKVIVTNSDSEILELALSSNNVVMGNASQIPVSAAIEATNMGWSYNQVNHNLNISAPQGLSQTDSSVFAGLTLDSNDTKNGIMFVNSDGRISTHTLNISEYESTLGVLSVEKGGTNNSDMPASGVLRSYGSGVDSFLSTGAVRLGSSYDEVDGILPVANGGTGVNSFSAGILYASAGNSLSTIPLANKLLVGTSGQPKALPIEGTANQVNITPAAGKITLSLPQDIHTGATPEFGAIKLNGLTGILKVEDGTLTGGNVISLATETAGVLDVSNGGTGAAALSQGPVAMGIDGHFIISNFNLDAVEYGESILPFDNGGTGTNNLPSGVVRSDGAKLSTGTVKLNNEVADILPVANGGTGRDSFTADRILYTSGETSISELDIPFGNILVGGLDGQFGLASFSKGQYGNISVIKANGSITLQLPQDVSSAASPVFSNISLTELSNPNDSGKIAGYSSNLMYFPVLSFNNVDFETSVISIADGGTGKTSFSQQGILYVERILDVDKVSELVLNSSHTVWAIATGKPSTTTFVSPDGNITFAFDDAENPTSFVLDTVQQISVTSTPTFAGLKLTDSDLAGEQVISIDPYGYVVKTDISDPITTPAALVADGGIGMKSAPVNGILVADTSTGLKYQTLAKGEILSFDTKVASATIVAGDNIVVDSSTEGTVQIGIEDTVNVTTFTVANVTMSDIMRLEPLTGCKVDDNGLSGQIRYCSTRCVPSGAMETPNDCASLSDFNKIVFFDGAVWKCLNRDEMGTGTCL